MINILNTCFMSLYSHTYQHQTITPNTPTVYAPPPQAVTHGSNTDYLPNGSKIKIQQTQHQTHHHHLLLYTWRCYTWFNLKMENANKLFVNNWLIFWIYFEYVFHEYTNYIHVNTAFISPYILVYTCQQLLCVSWSRGCNSWSIK